jgi:hypothetical protein
MLLHGNFLPSRTFVNEISARAFICRSTSRFTTSIVRSAFRRNIDWPIQVQGSEMFLVMRSYGQSVRPEGGALKLLEIQASQAVTPEFANWPPRFDEGEDNSETDRDV